MIRENWALDIRIQATIMLLMVGVFQEVWVKRDDWIATCIILIWNRKWVLVLFSQVFSHTTPALKNLRESTDFSEMGEHLTARNVLENHVQIRVILENHIQKKREK